MVRGFIKETETAIFEYLVYIKIFNIMRVLFFLVYIQYKELNFSLN